MIRRFLVFLAWLLGLLCLVAAILFLFRAPLLARFGISLPSGRAAATMVNVLPGFEVNIFAEGLKNPRFMTLGPEGRLFVTERGQNRVVALPDTDSNGKADRIIIVAEDFDQPSSLALRPGTAQLYVGETSRVSRLTLDGTRVTQREVVIDDLPSNRLHFTTTVLFGEEDELYVSMGSSCNVCEEKDARLAAVEVYESDGSGGQPFMTGLRNAVGLARNPVTGDIWATNNGRDLLGNERPPETVYSLEKGADAGWPRCHAGRIIDPEFGDTNACEGVAQPIIIDTAHSAPLGATFYDGSMFPESYQNDFFMAYHGSWNRTPPTGYKVVHVPLLEGKVAGKPEEFAWGWLKEDGSSTGRPVDVLVATDGALLISDDKAGIIYRVSYRKVAQ